MWRLVHNTISVLHWPVLMEVCRSFSRDVSHRCSNMLINSAWKGAIFQLKHTHWRSSPRYCGTAGGGGLTGVGRSLRKAHPVPTRRMKLTQICGIEKSISGRNVSGSTRRNHTQTNDKHALRTPEWRSRCLVKMSLHCLRKSTHTQIFLMLILRFTCHFSFLCKHSQMSPTFQHFPQRSHRQKDFAAKLLSIIRHPLTVLVFWNNFRQILLRETSRRGTLVSLSDFYPQGVNMCVPYKCAS